MMFLDRFTGLYPLIAPLLKLPKWPPFMPYITRAGFEAYTLKDRKVALMYVHESRDPAWPSFAERKLLANPYFVEVYDDDECHVSETTRLEWFIFDLAHEEEFWSGIQTGSYRSLPDSLKSRLLAYYRKGGILEWQYIDLRLNPKRTYNTYADFLGITSEELWQQDIDKFLVDENGMYYDAKSPPMLIAISKEEELHYPPSVITLMATKQQPELYLNRLGMPNIVA